MFNKKIQPSKKGRKTAVKQDNMKVNCGQPTRIATLITWKLIVGINLSCVIIIWFTRPPRGNIFIFTQFLNFELTLHLRSVCVAHIFPFEQHRPPIGVRLIKLCMCHLRKLSITPTTFLCYCLPFIDFFFFAMTIDLFRSLSLSRICEDQKLRSSIQFSFS